MSASPARDAIHGPPPSVDDVRSLHDIEAILEADPTVNPWPYFMRVAALEAGRLGRMPRSPFGLLELLARRMHLEANVWLPPEVRLIQQHDQRFRDLWVSVRILCERCPGYLVVRHQHVTRFRFAGCTGWTSDGCRFSMTSRDYARRKAAVVLDLLGGNEPEFGYIEVDPADHPRTREAAGYAASRYPIPGRRPARRRRGAVA